ncbi:MAG: hypothetical protein KJ626_00245 [Verrucomicrobia bacterium]|nr:hypothetical protein [Verrucomicrobiota bacterium]
MSWLREVQIEPRFTPPKEKWTVRVFCNVLHQIDEQYRDILEKKPNDADILFGLSRVCQHALYNLNRAVFLRRRQQTE